MPLRRIARVPGILGGGRVRRWLAGAGLAIFAGAGILAAMRCF